MVFSSPIFLFLFLPIFLLAYSLAVLPAMAARYPVQRKVFLSVSNLILLGSSLVFYFWGESWLVLVMLTSTFIDFWCGLAIGRFSGRRTRRSFLILSIVANLSLLAFFKYSGFGIDSFNSLVAFARLSHWQVPGFAEVALPLGISFYTFQSMSYTIDVYRREVEPTRNILGFVSFVTMFPQLVAGPIVRYRDVASQIVDRTIDRARFSYGCLRFIQGLGKKVLIAILSPCPLIRFFHCRSIN